MKEFRLSPPHFSLGNRWARRNTDRWRRFTSKTEPQQMHHSGDRRPIARINRIACHRLRRSSPYWALGGMSWTGNFSVQFSSFFRANSGDLNAGATKVIICEPPHNLSISLIPSMDGSYFGPEQCKSALSTRSPIRSAPKHTKVTKVAWHTREAWRRIRAEDDRFGFERDRKRLDEINEGLYRAIESARSHHTHAHTFTRSLEKLNKHSQCERHFNLSASVGNQ